MDRIWKYFGFQDQTPSPIPNLKKEYPEVIDITRIVSPQRPLTIELTNRNQIEQENIAFAENSLFNFFDWNLLEGDIR